MSRFRFSALLALSVAVLAVIVLRRDKRHAELAVPEPAAPAEPVANAIAEEAPVQVPSVEEPSVEEPPVAEAPIQVPVEEPAPRMQIPATPVQLHPETDGVSGADPVPGYWGVPPTPPAEWSDSPSFGERRSA
jgi:hypothetical protein